jgi:nitroimidazol reductase NimA-like FMN-containing flavoprotein (pyridoxamine 5'-phosphate oxidase superfamily)
MMIEEMREADCYSIVVRERMGRLGCCLNSQPYIVPIFYTYAETRLFSFSMPGRKVDFMRQNPLVCVQIDHFSDQHHWKSIVIEGKFRELRELDERQHGWEILQYRNDWWEPGALKPNHSTEIVSERSHLFYTISIDRISGRQTV